MDVRAEEEENVASEASMTMDDAPEEDEPVVQTSEIVEETALEVVDEDEEETEPAEKSGFMSSFFNRLVRDEPREILDESDEDESTQSDVDASVAEVTELAPDSDPVESLPEPESTPEPAESPFERTPRRLNPRRCPRRSTKSRRLSRNSTASDGSCSKRRTSMNLTSSLLREDKRLCTSAVLQEK